MRVIHDAVLGKERQSDAEGFSGDLLDSTSTKIATVVNGLIIGVNYTSTPDDLLLQNGLDMILMQNGTDNLLKQGN